MRRALYYEILSYQRENLELLREHFDLLTLPSPDEDTPKLLEEVEVGFAPLGYYWGKEKMDQAPRLKVIGSNTTGVPHIDMEYAAFKGIKVISLQNQTEFLDGITPTAEHTWGLILGVMRRIPWSFQAVREGDWNRRPFGGKTMLSKMSLGIVGLGRLGKMVARQAAGFGMRVRYYDPSEPSSPGDAEPMASLEDLVAASDIVTVHIPLNKENEGLFGRQIFSRFKEGAYFINTSRGEIVDSTALLEHLENGWLGGAGLDVLDGEFVPGFADRVGLHPLVRYARDHDNLVITPHTGGSTVDAWGLTEQHTIMLVLKELEEDDLRVPR